jgi:NTP pyrophosphatase (non-canonical NTP hydrolase)
MDEETQEILDILQEECAEVIQAISKCKRFGPDQVYSNDPKDETTNMKKVEKELGDVQAMVGLLIGKRIGVSRTGIAKAKEQKLQKLKKWSNIKVR